MDGVVVGVDAEGASRDDDRVILLVGGGVLRFVVVFIRQHDARNLDGFAIRRVGTAFGNRGGRAAVGGDGNDVLFPVCNIKAVVRRDAVVAGSQGQAGVFNIDVARRFIRRVREGFLFAFGLDIGFDRVVARRNGQVCIFQYDGVIRFDAVFDRGNGDVCVKHGQGVLHFDTACVLTHRRHV